MIQYPQPTHFPQGAALQDGVWTQTLSPKGETEGRAALFLDRDGVVVEEAHYLHNPDLVQITPNADETIRAANTRGIPVILVTNQAGIGYGYFGWDDFVAVQTRILGDLSAAGARVDGVFACPFHEKAQGVYVSKNHFARKPNPGMLTLASQIMGVNLEKSWIVGDRALDLQAGKNAGLVGGVHVWTGHGSKDGERAAALAVSDDTFTVSPATNLGEARGLVSILD